MADDAAGSLLGAVDAVYSALLVEASQVGELDGFGRSVFGDLAGEPDGRVFLAAGVIDEVAERAGLLGEEYLAAVIDGEQVGVLTLPSGPTMEPCLPLS